ncbi:MAG: hypothetical protein QF923_03500 [Candidatus Marinimicrobia bacterium]|nr:hypothetical protein [Candidatus Neomarinimicrobiota bacterium]
MDSLIQQLTDKPILLAVALILVAIMVYALIKRLMKVALFLLVLLAVYFGYLVLTGQDVHEKTYKLIDELPEGIQKAVDQGREVLEKGKEAVENVTDDIDFIDQKKD